MILLKQADKLKILTFVVKTFFIGLFFLFLLVLSIVVFWSYETFTFRLLDWYGKTDKLEIFRSHYLSLQKYNAIRVFLFVATVLAAIVLKKVNRNSVFLAHKLDSLAQSLTLGWNYCLQHYYHLTRGQKILVGFMLFFIGLVKWFFMERYFFHIDEIFSYLFFVRKGFLVIVSYYPGSNNHILYSLIAYASQPFFSNPFYLMKVPSLIISLFASALVFLFILKHFEFLSAMLGTLLFSFSGNLFFYSVFGRGYVLVTLFVIFSAFMAVELISGRDEKFFWYLYVLSSILGFYSMIVYIYPYVSFSIAVLIGIVYQKRYTALKEFFYYNIVIVVGVLILYAPILFVNGLTNLVSNPWTIKYELLEFIPALPKILTGILNYIMDFDGVALWIGLVIMLSAFVILFKTARISLFILIFSLFTAPVFVLIVQRVHTFDRVWTYLIFPFILCVVVILNFVFSKLDRLLFLRFVNAVFLASGIIGYTLYYFNRNTNHGHTIYDEVGRICRDIAVNANNEVYTNEDVYNIYLRYEASRLGKELVPVMEQAAGTNKYSYVLLRPNSQFPVFIDKNNYLLKEQNGYIEVYKRK